MTSERGFSLIEVLVALFILSTIAVGGTTILIRSIQSQETLERTADRVQTYGNAHIRIRDDLMQWVPRAFESRPAIDPNAYFLGGGLGDARLLFTFVRDGRTNPGLAEARSGLFAVRYSFENGELRRLTRPYSDPLYDADYTEEVLLTGLDDAYAEFRNGTQWVSLWRATPETPLRAPPVIRLTLVLENGDRLEWLFLTPGGGAI